MTKPSRLLSTVLLTLFALTIVGVVPRACAQHSFDKDSKQAKSRPWMNTSLSPDERAEMVLKQLSLDEKISLTHGNGMPGWGPPRPNAHLGNGGAGFVLGIERLGIPFIPSHTNFLYLSLKDQKQDLFSLLAKNNIKSGRIEEGPEKWSRITIGTMDQMKIYLQYVRQCYKA